MISFSDCSLYINISTNYFCVLILYPATLLNSFISSNRWFLWNPWGFLHIRSYQLQTDNYTSFPVWIPSLSFSCLIALAQSSSTILNRGCESGTPSSFLILEEKLSVVFHH